MTTQTGDKGSTGLANGKRISKSDPRIEFIGTLDELNSFIGFLRVLADSRWEPLLEAVQQDLFNLGGESSQPGGNTRLLGEERIQFLEGEIARMNAHLPPLEEFVLPAGDEFTTRVHLARTVCRRAERKAVALQTEQEENNYWIPYLNRLSDFLFVLARYHQQESGGDETLWDKNS